MALDLDAGVPLAHYRQHQSGVTLTVGDKLPDDAFVP